MTAPRLLAPLLLAPCLAFAAAGDLDPAFGTGGITTFILSTPTGPNLSGVGTVFPSHALLQPDGKFLALVRASDTGTFANVSYSVIARLETDGTPDATFGSAGVSLTNLSSSFLNLAPARMALQPDGKILVVGSAYMTSQPLQGAYLARFHADGTRDTGFTGASLAPFLSDKRASGDAVFVQPDGKVLMLGMIDDRPALPEMIVVRFLADGTLDSAFGTAGVKKPGIVGLGVYIRAAARQADGRIVVAVTPGSIGPSGNFLLYRLDADGAIDPTFGSGGSVATDFGGSAYVNDMALLPDGRILVAGVATDTFAPTGGTELAALARYTANGALDDTFGSAGKLTVAIAAPRGSFDSVALAADGRAVATGRANDVGGTGTAADIALARFLPDGSIDPNLGGTGKVVTDLGGGEWAVSSAIQADGRIVALVRRSSFELTVARYDGGGTTYAVTTSAANPVFAGQPASFTTRVFGLSPTGTVTFRRAGADIPGCVGVPLAAGAATCAGIVLPGGVQAIVAAYSGDGDDPAADAPPYLQYVLSPAGDFDDDGIPDGVEIAEGTDPIVKDNDVFAATVRGARLFAMQVYRDFLAREGDAAGIDFHAGLLANGSVTREQVIDMFLAAPEFEAALAPAIRLYFAAFDRIPDYAGLQFHAAALRGGAPLAGIAWNFALSPEFTATYGPLDDTQFVTLLYQNVLRRTATQPEIDFHVALLAAGTTRGEVLMGFSESAEHRQAVANEVLATLLYVGVLHRAPESAGLAYWRDLLDSGAARIPVIHSFLVSAEYRARFLP